MSELQTVENNQVADIGANQALAKKLENKRQVIKNTVAENATDDELEMFLHLAKEYGLDPFQGEIYFWKFGSKDPTIMTSRDGYLKIANQHPAFDSMDSGVIYPGDDFKKTQEGVEHSLDISNMSKKPVGAYAVVYRSDRNIPIRVIIPFEDYNKGNKVWNNYPSAMIQKCAESMSLKRAFSVSGLVSKEEMGYEQDNKPSGQFAEPSSNNSSASVPTQDKQSEASQKQKIINQIGEKVNDETDLLTREVVQDQMENIAGFRDLKKMGQLDLEQLKELKEICLREQAEDEPIDVTPEAGTGKQ